MRIQLWSYNYAPEPIGIAPVSTTWAESMAERGHAIDVVAAHPHYPRPDWGKKLLPYREVRAGVPVLRLPLWIGRDSGRARMRQDATFALAQLLASPMLGHPDALVSVSPCFPALGPAVVNVRARGLPWVLWLQDLLPDAAVNTGLIGEGRLLRAMRRYESLAYRTADRIVLISESHRGALIEKGGPAPKLEVITNPTTLPIPPRQERRFPRPGVPRILNIGNI